MAKEWDKIQSTFKKLQPQVAKLDAALADKLIVQIKAALETAWDAEEAFGDAIEAAQEGGLKGKKLSDFIADKPVKDSLAVLNKQGAKQESLVNALRDLSKKAAAPHKELSALLKDAKKHIDKKDKAQVKLQADLKADHAKAQNAAQAMGKLTAPETFYGARIDKVVDRVIKKASGAGQSAVSGDADKLIEQKERDKNVKAAITLAKQVAKLCQAALTKAEDSPKSATPYLKKSAELNKKLKSLNDAYLQVKKKSAALIKNSKDKSKIVKAIATISKAHDVSARRFSEALATIRAKSG